MTTPKTMRKTRTPAGSASIKTKKIVKRVELPPNPFIHEILDHVEEQKTKANKITELRKTNYPSDAMIVTYKVKDKVHFDLCRGSKVNIFDLYYDKFGKDSLQGIDFGHGNINPQMWGYKTKEKKKKRNR